MPKIVRVVNWHLYQHYKDRNPPWIKFYTRLIDGDCREFDRLKDEEKWQFCAILMLASRQQNAIPYDTEWISERLRLRSKLNLKALEATGMIEITDVASTALADCKQDAMPETEAETEKRRGEPRPQFSPPTYDDVEGFHEAELPATAPLCARAFVDYYTANGWHAGRNKMVNWKAAYKGWVRRELKGAAA